MSGVLRAIAGGGVLVLYVFLMRWMWRLALKRVRRARRDLAVSRTGKLWENDAPTFDGSTLHAEVWRVCGDIGIELVFDERGAFITGPALLMLAAAVTAALRADELVAGAG